MTPSCSWLPSHSSTFSGPVSPSSPASAPSASSSAPAAWATLPSSSPIINHNTLFSFSTQLAKPLDCLPPPTLLPIPSSDLQIPSATNTNTSTDKFEKKDRTPSFTSPSHSLPAHPCLLAPPIVSPKIATRTSLAPEASPKSVTPPSHRNKALYVYLSFQPFAYLLPSLYLLAHTHP
ncbi:hypothetical protein PtA15_1A690 [Puccinia triticina]|uniref:REJ domain-containing protein n=1 Tax=Puccinia triticina TaxID=208348 RepID=A0ABY7CBV0_9BASI|nr:uncharacterized protein PtA15_1A690 [Puccinia triticina]WAQ81350.1 hypothetical protein PtA15_1A690 [Puccinia triticina]